MHVVSRKATVLSTGTVRSLVRDTEENFGSIFNDIIFDLWPPPNSAAKAAADIGCGVRNIELCLQKQKWSGEIAAAIVAEILRRHRMRNVKIKSRADG